MTTKSLKESYLQKSGSSKTWSGIPLKIFYGPEDVKGSDYAEKLGNPGEYPFARGIYETMYRGRVWSHRQITGCSTPRLTNERFRLLIEQGETAINMIGDQPTMNSIDSDHPWAEGSVGRSGVPICSMKDMWTVMDGIPLDEVSTMLTLATPVAFPSYLLLADKQDIPYSKLRITMFAHPPSATAPVCMYGGRERYNQQLARDLENRWIRYIDRLEFAAKYLPKSYPTNHNAYNIRETGVGAVEEVAWILANAFEAYDRVVERGIDIDQVAPKVSFTFSVMIDIFEEAAKFRAARRIYARTMKERYGAKDPSSMKLKFHVNTAGVMMQRPQAILNIVRASYGALAAVLGGTQSLQVASYDEPIAIPTDKAATIALRTQQILATETGVTGVADPLGGSYYIESLTDKLEDEIQKVIVKINEIGGMTAAVTKGYIDGELQKAWLNHQKEVENKEKIVVGVNEYIIPEEEDEEVIAYHHEVDWQLVQAHIDSVLELKKTRDNNKARKALENLMRSYEKPASRDITERIQLEKEACASYCTTGEISGAFRMAAGLPYDPMGVIDYPFK